MRKKDKNQEAQVKKDRKKWGVGKTLAVLFSSVAFIVGAAILGVYLAGGFVEKIIVPQDVSFNEQNDENYNAELNRIEATQDFVLTIGSSTSNITANNVSLSFAYTYTYDFDAHDFTDKGWGTEEGDGYIDNGVLRIPKQVKIGQPFTVTLSTYKYTDAETGVTIDQIRGGISTIVATSQNQDLSPISLTIAVDCPVHRTETVLLDRKGNEILVDGDLSEVIEEEDFYVTTKFYPEESRYMYCDKTQEKTTYYQIRNIESSSIETIYDSASTLHFHAGQIAEGGIIDGFTAVTAKVQKQIETEVSSMGLDQSNYESLYNAFINKYSNAEAGKILTADELKINVVQASVKSFNVGKAEQTMKIFKEKDLKIFVGNNIEEDGEFLGVKVISQNGIVLNNILANVVLSFSLDGIDPTSGDSPILMLTNEDGQILRTTQINGVTYYFPYNPAIDDESDRDYGYGYWTLKIADGYVGKIINVTVSLLFGNAIDGYQLFSDQSGAVQHTFDINIVEHVEGEVAWKDSSAKEVLLTYAEGGTQPLPATLNLNNQADIPQDNVYKTIKYFAYFEGLSSEEALLAALKMFDEAVEKAFAGEYQTYGGNKYLIPLSISGDRLIIKEVGDFELYFATIDGSDSEQSKYNTIKFVANPINVHVTKTLYKNSVVSANISYKKYDADDFVTIDNQIYMPTYSDSTEKDQIKLSFNIASDSIQVFKEEFERGRIQLKIYSEQDDLTTYFIAENGEITESVENNTATLSFILRANSSASVLQDTIITNIALNYNSESVGPLIWDFAEIYQGGNISLYTPSAQSVFFGNGLGEEFSVTQTLGANGIFETIIQDIAGGEDYDLQTLIPEIQQTISIVDQHERSETLANSWIFTSDNSILQISSGSDGISGHGFNFNGGEGTANLGMSCGGQISNNTINFEISAQGITKIEYDTSLDPSYEQIDGDATGQSSARVEKYGQKGQTLTLNDILKFYVGDNGEIPYTNVTFKLSPTYLTPRTEEELNALFGKGGMLTINGQELETVSSSILQGISFQSLTINKNFDTNHQITFLVTDSSGAVNFTFTLNILDNVSVSAQSTINDVYANSKTTIDSSIQYNYGQEDNSNPKDLLDGYQTESGTEAYYIVPSQDDENKFEIEKFDAKPENAVGYLTTDNKIVFYHFYSVENKTFSVTFRPEGNNLYSTSYTILFNVIRNIKVEQKETEVSAFETAVQQFEDYVNVSQIAGDTSNITKSYIADEQNSYLNVEGGSFTVAQEVRFNYNVTKLAQNITIKIGEDDDYFEYSITISVVLPEGFWSGLTQSFVADDDTNPSYQIAGTNNTKYLVFEPKQYTIGSYSSGATEYTITPSQKDGDLTITNYTVMNNGDSLAITYNGSTSNLLLGYESSEVYTLYTFAYSKKKVVVVQPTIISRIGTTFALYGDAEKDGGNNEFSLANALKSPTELYSSGTYYPIQAGKSTGLYLSEDKTWGINNSFNITAGIKAVEGSKVGDTLPDNLLYKFDSANGAITLNHLSTDYSNAYLSLTYTISVGDNGVSQTFNYLFKVNANAQVKPANYPYGGQAEYIYISTSLDTIDLNESFGETTPKNGEKRFNVLGSNDKELPDLKYEDKILSVTIETEKGTSTFTDPSQWASYISFSLENSILTIQPKTTQTITFVVRRSYNGGNGEGQSVVGGTIDYTFILNDNSLNYSIRIEDGSESQNNVKDYDWQLNDWANTAVVAPDDVSETRTESKQVYLVENWTQEGGALSGTIILSKLSFTMHKDANSTIKPIENGYSITTDTNTFSFAYNSVTGKFDITYPSYLDKQYTFTATLYTERGDLATINFVFNADAKEEVKKTSFTGGQDVDISEIFSIRESGASGPVEALTLDNIFATGDLANFVKQSGNDIQLASVIGDDSISGDLTITVKWNNDSKTYTFTIPNFTITPNLTANNYSIENQIAGKNTTLASNNIDINNINIKEGEIFSASNSKITLRVEDGFSNSAVECINNDGTITINYNNVGAETTVEVPVIITVAPSFTGTTQSENVIATTKKIIVTIIIHPNVKISAVYPSPNTEETLELEYIKDGTVFEESTISFNKEENYNYFEVLIFEENTWQEYTGKISSYNYESKYDISGVGADTTITITETTIGQPFKVVFNDGTEALSSESEDKQVSFGKGTYQYFRIYVGENYNQLFNGELNGIEDLVHYKGYDITSVEIGSLIGIDNPQPEKQAKVVYAGEEYLAVANPTFESAFLKTNAIFADKARIQVKYASLNRETNEIDYTTSNTENIEIDNKVVSIKALNNAVVTQLGESLKVNSNIDLNQTVTFSRGTSGGASTVTLSISYNNYVIDYEIEIQTNPFALSLNQASNNISGDSSGQYEIIYVDKTNTTDLFAKNRMAQVVLSSNASAGDYYIVFENAGETPSYQISKVINLSESFVSLNKGKTIYLDLGNNDLGTIGNDSNIYVFTDEQYQSAVEAKQTDEKIAQYLVDNYASKNLLSSMFTSFKLTARVSMTYGGWEVSYDNISTGITLNLSETPGTQSGLSNISISSNSVEIGTTEDLITSFVFNNIITFNNPYRYKAEIDIEVGIDGENGGYVPLQVQGSIDIVDAFNIRRASTQQPIAMDEMVSSGANFTLESQGITNNVPDSTYKYTSISPIRTDYVVGSPQYTYDYRIIGNGAGNNGNDVSYTLTYTVGGFSKTFTLKVHVEPDYIFDFGGSNNTTSESDGISNQNNPYKINTSEFTDSVGDLVLAGEDEAAYLSITHQNSSTLGEQSVSAFNYKMTVNNRVGDTTYNIGTNISNKLNIGTSETQNNWVLESTKYSWNKGTNTSLIFKSVKAVELGTQYYRLEAVDNYGFKFYLYFELSSGGSDPEIYTTSGSSTLSLTEGDTISFGAEYEELTVTAEGTKLEISSSKKDVTTGNNPLINIRNLEAWGFTTDYTNDYLKNKMSDQNYKEDGYQLSDGYKLKDDSLSYYLNNPSIKYITVDKVSFYYQNGNEQIEVGTTNKNQGKEIATKAGLQHNPSTIFVSANASSLGLPSVGANYTWIFKDTNSVELNMVVTLKYLNNNTRILYGTDTFSSVEAGNTVLFKKTDSLNYFNIQVFVNGVWKKYTGEIEGFTYEENQGYDISEKTGNITVQMPLGYRDIEYFDMTQKITLNKKNTVASKANLLADNTEVDLTNYIDKTESIYDDTLAVAVQGKNNTSYTLTYEIGNEEVSVTVSEANGTNDYQKLYYRSISAQFDTVLIGNNTVTITPHDGNAAFYYGTDSDSNSANKKLEGSISVTVQKDVNYFKIETKDNNGSWANYTNDVGNYKYDENNGGYPVGNNGTVTITMTENFRVVYNGKYYYPQYTLTIAQITKDLITVSNQKELASASREMQVQQYYVVTSGGKAYRYTQTYYVSGTFKEITYSGEIRTLPASGSIEISKWAEGIYYTTINSDGKTYITNNLLKKYGSEDSEIMGNLYFVITSGISGGGGTGLATIDSDTGEITLLEGFTPEHFVTVEIYQKVSGIDGQYDIDDLSQMQLLKTIEIYPKIQQTTN